MTDQKNVQEQGAQKVSRRNILKAAVAAGGAAMLGFPMIAKGQTGPITMRWQSTWPAKDIFHEYANDFAKKVTDMTGGDLKIEVLPAGAVVPAFGLLDAVSKGTLDGGHGVLVYHYGKQTALALWVRRRQGSAQQALRLHRRQRRFLPLRPDADPAARLVQEADHQGRRFQGSQVPHRGHLD
jgi:hypothetical protein